MGPGTTAGKRPPRVPRHTLHAPASRCLAALPPLQALRTIARRLVRPESFGGRRSTRPRPISDGNVAEHPAQPRSAEPERRSWGTTKSIVVAQPAARRRATGGFAWDQRVRGLVQSGGVDVPGAGLAMVRPSLNVRRFGAQSQGLDCRWRVHKLAGSSPLPRIKYSRLANIMPTSGPAARHAGSRGAAFAIMDNRSGELWELPEKSRETPPRRTLNQLVVGSSPTGGTKTDRTEARLVDFKVKTAGNGRLARLSGEMVGGEDHYRFPGLAANSCTPNRCKRSTFGEHDSRPESSHGSSWRFPDPTPQMVTRARKRYRCPILT